MSNETPRTDAVVTGNSEPTQDEYEDLAFFARELERELSKLEEVNEAKVESLAKERDELLALFEEMRKIGFLRKNIKPSEVAEHMSAIARSWRKEAGDDR